MINYKHKYRITEIEFYFTDKLGHPDEFVMKDPLV